LNSAFRNIIASRTGSYTYNIYIDTNVMVDGVRLKSLLNIISNGNREVRGYRIIHDVFLYVANNVNNIY